MTATMETADRLKREADELAPFVSKDTMARFRWILAEALDMVHERDIEIGRLRAEIPKPQPPTGVEMMQAGVFESLMDAVRGLEQTVRRQADMMRRLSERVDGLEAVDSGSS